MRELLAAICCWAGLQISPAPPLGLLLPKRLTTDCIQFPTAQATHRASTRNVEPHEIARQDRPPRDDTRWPERARTSSLVVFMSTPMAWRNSRVLTWCDLAALWQGVSPCDKSKVVERGARGGGGGARSGGAFRDRSSSWFVYSPRPSTDGIDASVEAPRATKVSRSAVRDATETRKVIRNGTMTKYHPWCWGPRCVLTKTHRKYITVVQTRQNISAAEKLVWPHRPTLKPLLLSPLLRGFR